MHFLLQGTSESGSTQDTCYKLDGNDWKTDASMNAKQQLFALQSFSGVYGQELMLVKKRPRFRPHLRSERL